MAIHEYTGITGKITVNGTLVGFVNGDVTFERTIGEYVEIGEDTKSHTFGIKQVSGTLKKAWGIQDSDLYDLFNNKTIVDIEFDADEAGTHTYKASGCVISTLSIEGLDAGSEGALLINAPFVGKEWLRD